MGIYASKQNPKEIQEPFNEIISILNNLNIHIEVKKYLLKIQLNKLKSFTIKNSTYSSLHYLLFDNNIFYLFGIFGPFNISHNTSDNVYTGCSNYIIKIIGCIYRNILFFEKWN